MSKPHNKSILNYVPISITSSKWMPRTKWQLLPGLWLEKISKDMKLKLEEIDSKRFPKMNFKANYAIRIDNRKYTNELKTRLTHEGKSIPEIPEDIDPILGDARNLAKLIIISMILQKNFRFNIAYTYSLEKVISAQKNVSYRMIGTSLDLSEQCLYNLPHFFPNRKKSNINRRALEFTINTLECYFRPYTWSVDRLSVALSNFWNALTANNISQSFLNLTIMLESLLSTSRNEITHILSERAAILLGKTPENRIGIYNDFKKIYSQRSKIVHGDGVPKKGTLNWDSYIISTKLSIVPQNLTKKLIDYALQLLVIIINNKEIMNVIQSSKKEGKINEELDAIYLKLLMKSK